jgi:hypothetical protein
MKLRLAPVVMVPPRPVCGWGWEGFGVGRGGRRVADLVVVASRGIGWIVAETRFWPQCSGDGGRISDGAATTVLATGHGHGRFPHNDDDMAPH